jgi:hypothetical protein
LKSAATEVTADLSAGPTSIGSATDRFGIGVLGSLPSLVSVFALARRILEFYESVPEHVRHRGPWQVQHRREVANLNTKYLLDFEEQGYALVRCELAVFKPEA